LALVATIESIKDRISRNSYRNESDVREAIVNRVLHDLGWDIYDPSVVSREFTVEKRRLDFALFITSSSSPAVILEVKAPNLVDEGDRQLFEYAFYQGTPFAVLVNGRDWSFYLPAEQGNYFERRVQKLDLLEGSQTIQQVSLSATYSSTAFGVDPHTPTPDQTTKARLVNVKQKKPFHGLGRVGIAVRSIAHRLDRGEGCQSNRFSADRRTNRSVLARVLTCARFVAIPASAAYSKAFYYSP
jgi:Type I restriction enzyme R protein N terminus (HSDR_N)